MKLRDAIENRDYSNFKKVEHPFFEIGYGYGLSHILYDTHIDFEHYDAVIKTRRLEQYAIREWLCSDEHVGLYLYTIDKEPVCFQYQDGRKCEPQWEFLSQEAFRKMKDLFDQCKPPELENHFSLVEDDFLDLDVDPKLFGSMISKEQMGFSPLEKHRWVLTHINLHNLDIKNLMEDYVKELRLALYRHETVLDCVTNLSDKENVSKYKKSEDIYEVLKIFLRNEINK